MNIWRIMYKEIQSVPLVNAKNSSSSISSPENAPSDDDLDDLHLRKLGYAPKLHRGLSAFSNFAVSFSRYSNRYKFSESFVKLGWIYRGSRLVKYVLSVWIRIVNRRFLRC